MTSANPSQIPEAERDYYLERKYPSYGNLAPRDISSRAAKEVCDEGRGIGETGLGVYLDFSDSIKRLGKSKIEERYGNLFEMYEKITGGQSVRNSDAYLPGAALHDGRTLGRLQSDEQYPRACMCIGEANFSDHGANRLGASALMQGLADGYFVLPYTIGDYLATSAKTKVSADNPAFKKAEEASTQQTKKLLSIKGKRTVDSFHRELGTADVGTLRHGAQRSEPDRRRSNGSRRFAKSSGRT